MRYCLIRPTQSLVSRSPDFFIEPIPPIAGLPMKGYASIIRNSFEIEFRVLLTLVELDNLNFVFKTVSARNH